MADIKTVKVDKYNKDLRGCVSINRNSYPVKGTILDELVEVEVINGKNKTANLRKVVKPSKYRVKPLCPIYQKCGGCSLLHIDYNEQLRIKQEHVQNLFKEKLGMSKGVLLTVGMENPCHYRNKNQIVFKNTNTKERIISGFYQEGTHNVINFDTCYIQDEVSDKIVKTIKKLMVEMKINAFDEDRKTGLIRHILVKRSNQTKEVMVVFVIASTVFPGRTNFIKKLVSIHPEITTIIQNINNRSTRAVLGENETVLYGKGYIYDILLNKKFKISSKSFYQINSVQTAKLYSLAIEAAKLNKDDVILDTYCGVGTIGIIASDYVKQVLSVEIVKDAVNDAIDNAKTNNVKNIKFFCDDASNFMVNLAKNKQHVDVVIMDPPRKGSDERFINAVLKLAPKRIVYISCNPDTLTNDLKLISKDKYRISYIQPVDMFPHTNSIETIVILNSISKN